IGIVRTGLGRRHATALLAVERVLEAHGVNAELPWRETVENALRVVRAVVGPDPRVVAAHDEMSAPVILAYERVEHGLARTRVSPRGREDGRQHAIRRIVTLEENPVSSPCVRGIERQYRKLGG